MKKNIGVIGQGKWGQKVIKELQKISNIKFIYNSKSNYKKFSEKISWVFILTPNESHYKIAKYFLNKKINVFCEKPLATKIYQAKNLIKLSDKNRCKLYVDDLENYKKKKIIIDPKLNFIMRTKKDKGDARSLLYRLAYHDFYLLEKYIEIKNIKSLKINYKKKFLELKMILKNNQTFIYNYDINSKDRKHLINNTDFNDFQNNPLKDMLNKVLLNKVNFKRNNIVAIKCLLIIDLIRKLK